MSTARRASWFARFGALYSALRGDDHINPHPRAGTPPAAPSRPPREAPAQAPDALPRDGAGGVDLKPTDSELRRAFALAYRVSWPPAYEDAMADPVISRLVEMVARYSPAINRASVPGRPRQDRPTLAAMLRAAEANPAVVKATTPRTPTYPPAPVTIRPAAPRFIDGKSRAAGEKPDDD